MFDPALGAEREAPGANTAFRGKKLTTAHHGSPKPGSKGEGKRAESKQQSKSIALLGSFLAQKHDDLRDEEGTNADGTGYGVNGPLRLPPIPPRPTEVLPEEEPEEVVEKLRVKKPGAALVRKAKTLIDANSVPAPTAPPGSLLKQLLNTSKAAKSLRSESTVDPIASLVAKAEKDFERINRTMHDKERSGVAVFGDGPAGRALAALEASEVTGQSPYGNLSSSTHGQQPQRRTSDSMVLLHSGALVERRTSHELSAVSPIPKPGRLGPLTRTPSVEGAAKHHTRATSPAKPKWVALSSGSHHMAGGKERPKHGRTIAEVKQEKRLEEQRKMQRRREMQSPAIVLKEKEEERKTQQLEHLTNEIQRYAELIVQQEREREEREASNTMRRTTATVIAEWKENMKHNPKGLYNSHEEREKAAMMRKATRMAKQADEEERRRKANQLLGASLLSADSDTFNLSAVPEPSQRPVTDPTSDEVQKFWRVPKGVTVEVYPNARNSCIVVTTITGERILKEIDSKVINGILWVRLDLPPPHSSGWVASQYSFEGIVKIQLMPEAGQTVQDIQAFMLDECDVANEKIEETLEMSAPERLKSYHEVREQFKQAQPERQKVRDLPGGHYNFILQTWQSMEKSTHQQRLIKERKMTESSLGATMLNFSSNRRGDAGEDDEAPPSDGETEPAQSPAPSPTAASGKSSSSK